MLAANMKTIVICAAMPLAAGCAKRPEGIKATPVAVDTCAQLRCPQLAQLKMQKDAELAGLEKEQGKVADDDFAAMVVFHVPAGSMGGRDREAHVARAKGEVQAIHSAFQSKDCAAA